MQSEIPMTLSATPTSLFAGGLCVAISAPTPDQMLARIAASLGDSHFLELRLDSLSAPSEFLPQIPSLLAKEKELTLLATCRRQPGGGAFTGSVEEELLLLEAAAQAGCQLVDLEIESAEEAGTERVARFRQQIHSRGAELLVSFHDFATTPDLEAAARRILTFQPEFLKVVATAHKLADNLPVFDLIRRHAPTLRVVAISMSETGLASRILGLRAGAAFTFASASDGTATAPGQVTAAEMLIHYRAAELTPATRIYGVAGNPIGHSMSPRMQNAAFRAKNIDSILLPLKCDDAADLITLARELPLSGCAVTMPLKQQVLDLLDGLTPLARQIGAANTLYRDAENRLMGTNTDVDGILRPLRKRLNLKGSRIALLGAGGAARAAAFGLVAEGAELAIINRTHATALQLAQECGAKAITHNDFAASTFDVLLNSTPCGMAGNPRLLPIEPDELHASLVFDMVYNPLRTPLLALAESRGIPTISGLEMFVQQGVGQFELWTGQTAPEAEMEQVVRQALGA